jgi:hypothetical protein
MGAGAQYAEKHISSMSACYNEQLGVRRLSRDQTWTLKCNYDYDKFPGNKGEKGKQESIMCISLMYIAIPPGGVTLRS